MDGTLRYSPLFYLLFRPSGAGSSLIVLFTGSSDMQIISAVPFSSTCTLPVILSTAFALSSVALLAYIFRENEHAQRPVHILNLDYRHRFVGSGHFLSDARYHGYHRNGLAVKPLIFLGIGKIERPRKSFF